MRYDCIIIGSGPAGLSAAINLTTYQKKFLWFGDANLSEKVEKAELVNNYPGLPGVSGKDLLRAFQSHKDTMEIEVTDKIVGSIYDMGGYYNVMAENQFYETDSIILAMGVVNTKQYIGETEFLGRGVSYCATCDGALYRDKKIAVISTAKRFEHEIQFLADLAAQIYLFPFYKDCEVIGSNVELVTQIPKEIKGGLRAEEVLLADGKELKVDGVFIMRNAIAPTTLLPKLELEDGHIRVNRQMETNLKGVFAAGDCTGKPYQYTKAVGEGNIAAHSAIAYLGEK